MIDLLSLLNSVCLYYYCYSLCITLSLSCFSLASPPGGKSFSITPARSLARLEPVQDKEVAKRRGREDFGRLKVSLFCVCTKLGTRAELKRNPLSAGGGEGEGRKGQRHSLAFALVLLLLFLDHASSLARQT